MSLQTLILFQDDWFLVTEVIFIFSDNSIVIELFDFRIKVRHRARSLYHSILLAKFIQFLFQCELSCQLSHLMAGRTYHFIHLFLCFSRDINPIEEVILARWRLWLRLGLDVILWISICSIIGLDLLNGDVLDVDIIIDNRGRVRFVDDTTSCPSAFLLRLNLLISYRDWFGGFIQACCNIVCGFFRVGLRQVPLLWFKDIRVLINDTNIYLVHPQDERESSNPFVSLCLSTGTQFKSPLGEFNFEHVRPGLLSTNLIDIVLSINLVFR